MITVVLTSFREQREIDAGVPNELAEAYNHLCGSILNVELSTEFLPLPTDAIVVFGNSFGHPTEDTVENRITAEIGHAMYPAIQKQIQKQYLGELLVGQAVIAPIGGNQSPYIIYAPINRVYEPQAPNSINYYLALKGAIRTLMVFGTVMKNVASPRIIVPGLRTGVAGMRPISIARQSYLAITEALYKPSQPKSWQEALRLQRSCIG